MMEWAKATFLDQLLHGLWLDPDEVRDKFDLATIGTLQRSVSAALVEDWHRIAPASDAAVIEFDFRVVGNAKRKLLRRLSGHHISQHRGGLVLRGATSLKWLDDYALAYDISARECGGALLGWRFVQYPLRD